MIVLDEVPGAAPPESPGPSDDPGRGRRWPIYLVLALVLLAIVTGIVLSGVDNASAAGGCGGG